MIFSVGTHKASEVVCEALVAGVYEGEKGLSQEAKALDKLLAGALTKVIIAQEFKGKVGSVVSVHTQGRIHAEQIVLVGLGKKGALASYR